MATPSNSSPRPDDSADGNATGLLTFSDERFICKVYSILTAQFAIEGFFIFLFAYCKDQKIMPSDVELLPIVMISSFILVIFLVLICCKSLARTNPFKCLFLLTVAEGFLLGLVATTRGTEQVLLPVGIITLICFSLTIYTFLTKIDFTAFHGVLFIIFIVLISAGLILKFMAATEPIEVVYSCGGVLIFSLFLVYNTQRVIINRGIPLSREDYVFAALSVSLEINLPLFVYLSCIFILGLLLLLLLWIRR